MVLFVFAIATFLSACETKESCRSILFSYLTEREVTPSLIAFNPSGFDPRNPFEVNEESLAKLREDLRVLKAAFNG